MYEHLYAAYAADDWAFAMETLHEVARTRGLSSEDNGDLEALIGEVSGLVQAVLEAPRREVREEAVRVAAVACRVAVDHGASLAQAQGSVTRTADSKTWVYGFTDGRRIQLNPKVFPREHGWRPFNGQQTEPLTKKAAVELARANGEVVYYERGPSLEPWHASDYGPDDKEIVGYRFRPDREYVFR